MMRAIKVAEMTDMAYGKDDCCLWPAGIIMQHEGPDIAKPFRGYVTEAGSIAALKKYAGGGLLQAALKRAGELEFEEVRAPFKDGDLALVINKTGLALALSFRGVWVARSKTGISYLPDYYAVIAWRLSCLQ